jgi:GT2 family glycosyltransferase
MPKISICIPTYKRHDLLKVAVEACLEQTFQDFEIVISDDSPDTKTEDVVRNISARQTIRYVRNTPGLGQAKNVNQLFNLAQGEFLVLVHDDNFQMPTALEDLLNPLEEHPSVVASFGKHYVARNDGSILYQESETVNRNYFKNEETADKVQPSGWSAMVLQFPADGYMVRTEAARKTLYRDSPEIGEACDAEFGYRLAELGEFFFVGKYTHTYRLTDESISSKGLRVHLSKQYFILRGRTVPSDLETVRRKVLRELAPVAVNGCLLTAQRAKALSVLFGPDYPWAGQFVKGLVQLGLAFAPRSATRMIIARRACQKEATPGASLFSAAR